MFYDPYDFISAILMTPTAPELVPDGTAPLMLAPLGVTLIPPPSRPVGSGRVGEPRPEGREHSEGLPAIPAAWDTIEMAISSLSAHQILCIDLL
ncbi:MAG: hypothetical protein QME16_05195 [Planctomycetota bacterium]|nr:hypothetical protein [Planctomycetota bacterium]